MHLLLVQLPSVVPCNDSISKNFPLCQQKVDHRGIRTPNLQIRSQTLYPFGHAAMCTANCVCCLFSCQVLFLVMTRYLRTFALCQTKSRPQRDSNPESSDSKSDALSVVPCGHVYCQLYLLLVQLPSVVPCVDSISKKFPLFQAKTRPQRDPNPQSSDSKSDALSVGPCGHVSCQLYLLLVQLPSVVPCNDSIFKKYFLSSKKSATAGFETPIL